ncbi:MAG: membrane protein insertase YidC [Acidobacteria bacterium]|jgi:YidC/Oxa1 family membrane protein insertase|nr:membrane protein insertase YidC [Acidobacteriota bacterium]
MDRDSIIRTIAAVALSILILTGWTYFFPNQTQAPPSAATPGQTAPADPSAAPPSAAAAAASSGAAPPPVPAAELTPGQPSGAGPAIAGAENQPLIEVRTPQHEITLTARGGKVVSWKLPGYEKVPGDSSKGLVDLVSSESRALDRNPLSIDPHDPALFKQINDAWYVVDRTAPTAEELAARGLPAGTQRVAFRWADGAGLEVAKSLWIPGDDLFTVRAEWSLTRQGQPVPGAAITWGPGVGAIPDPTNRNQYAYRGLAVAALAEKPTIFSPSKQEGDIAWPAGLGPRWLALDEQYFAVAMIPAAPAASELRVFPIPGAPSGEERQLMIGSASPALTLFVGPKSSPVLRKTDAALGLSLSGLIQWGMWGWLARPLYTAMEWLHGLIGNWGWAIVTLSALIRLVFFPLMHRSMVKMRKTQQDMARVQPKIHKIKEKYKDSRDMDSRKKMNEEMMELYKREGVNPMASLTGCLPLLLQFPVMLAMYSLLTVAVDLRGAPWIGWIRDLSAADPYWVLPIVMGATQLLQSFMTMTKTEDPQQRAQQRMMLIMPVVFTWFFLYMPAGLVLYWLVSNVLGIVQQYFINRHADAAPPAAAPAGAKAR